MNNKFPVILHSNFKSDMGLMLTNDSAISIADNTIENNAVDGDINVVGNQTNFNITVRSADALLALIERSKQLTLESSEYRNMIEELDSFLENRPSRRIIGLEAKLNTGGRADLVEDALYLENRFARRLARGQHSPSSQALFLHCLSEINSSFCHYIQPLIRSAQPTVAIDAAIKLRVIDPICRELAAVDCSYNSQMISGMLYFLTGKCHIQWE